ncbi:cytochrome bd-I oxidase subunit CydX [Burkholderia theae]|uniref:cytochrome bd-I oxidase subunit CydX n=1 Tax=Burkholderia theae TaxID=3143496 RepID=UPI003AFAB8AE
MWYFSWILGICVALGFGIINAMWLEAEVFSRDDKRADTRGDTSGQKLGSRYS